MPRLKDPGHPKHDPGSDTSRIKTRMQGARSAKSRPTARTPVAKWGQAESWTCRPRPESGPLASPGGWRGGGSLTVGMGLRWPRRAWAPSGRLGEHTRLAVAGTFIGHDTAAACEEAVDVEAASGARDFVFDLSRVGRHDTGALRSIAGLWRRLHGPRCAVVVAAANPAVCLNRVIPAPLEVDAEAHAGRGAHPSAREPCRKATVRPCLRPKSQS